MPSSGAARKHPNPAVLPWARRPREKPELGTKEKKELANQQLRVRVKPLRLHVVDKRHRMKAQLRR